MRKIVFKNRICEKCKAYFTPRSSTQAWCDACLTKICAWCKQPFHIRKKSRYETANYCSTACARKAYGAAHGGVNSPVYKNGNRSEKVTVQCSVCGKQIEREKKQAEAWEIHFCSNACRSVFQSENKIGENNPRYARVEKVCDWCGKAFETWPSVQEKARFCSMQCRNDWQSEQMSGENHHNWKGGKTHDRESDMAGRDYKAWRKAVFERDGFACRICGDARGGNLNAHHIKPYRDFPELRHEVSNGITLCENCHIQVHKNMIDIQSELQQ